MFPVVPGNFANWLQGELVRRDMSPAELADAMNSPRATVTRILNEERGVGKDVARKIAVALKVDTELVLFKAGISERDPESPKEQLDPIALDILQMLENRTDAEKKAALAALQALFDGLDRGLDGGQAAGSGGRSSARKNQG